MNGIKKSFVRILVILYGLSYLLQNTFFIDRKKVYAAENPSTTNMVAVFVDKNIYKDIESNLERYTTEYIQKKIANSKAVVFPIEVTTLKAHEIAQILENMYFEGLKDESSKLVGTILIGDVPLPVVENNGFIYPSIYPYVDFEHQQFIYDTNKKFFVYNDNPNGQAELRHGIIKFEKPAQYNAFFDKVKSYKTNPTKFIDKAIRYEDFIGLKKYFIPENTKYYVNSMIFAEDIGYHRFTNLLLNTLKDEHNDSALTLGSNLKDDLQDVTDPELKAYADDMESRNDTATALSQQVSSSMPTMTLKKATQEMLKGYDGLFSSQFLAKIKDNVGGLARRYKTTDGETFPDYSSLTDKIVQKDNWIVGDSDNNVQPLLIQINDFLESGLNAKIDQEKYYMTIPIPVSQLDFEGELKPSIIPKCIWSKYAYYENYYFGRNANQITSAENTSIYKGTYQNLTSISGQNVINTGQSIGGSYKIFSTQVEANRGYNISSATEELERYATLKTNKQDLRNKECNLHLFGYCIRRKKTRKANDSADEDKCYINDEEKQGGCETLKSFTARYRGGASPINIDPTTQNLVSYNYKDAKFPIFDIAGSKRINVAQPDANGYTGAETYTNLIQTRFGAKEKQEEKYSSIFDFINNPNANGIDIKFTNQIVINSDLEHPIRAYNPPKTYAQSNFFTLYNILPSHTIYGGKAILYNRTSPTDIGNCNMKGQVSTYKTIDSRVKNTSPTRNQISDTEFYKFKDGSDIYAFYMGVMTDLSQTKANVVKKTVEFSGADATDITGVVSNLARLKKSVASGNNGMQEITTFAPASLLGMNASQVTAKANDWNGKNISPTKIVEMEERITKINDGLQGLLDYINNLNINTVQLSFNNIVQSEGFKNQKVEILDTRKSQIITNLDYITTNVNVLKSKFATARGVYNTVGQLNNNIGLIQIKRSAIAALQSGNGCTITYYKPICDVLDNLVVALQNNLSDINDKINKIAQHPGDNGVMQPFIEINQVFASADIASEIAQSKMTVNTFNVSTDPDKKETNKGMNLMTSDRPIDNIRNITFKGIGGDSVRLNYPNLYEVRVYKEDQGKLVLKDITEIREAIKEYLRNKAKEYNTLLNAQIQKRNNGYYNTFSAQFIMLGQLDPLANPNTHNYSQDSIPEDYFINQTIALLDILENAPEYGKKAIYGITDANTTNEKLDMLAKLLYYQNITWPEKLEQQSVVDDIAETKESFDINQKISAITNTYLTEGNDQGKFITPVYNTTGYEVGYINSDGEDYLSSKTTPGFIQQIQTAQEKATTKNIFVEASPDELQQDVDSCEGVDTDGTALLFDFKTFSSPRGKAMKCWIKKIMEKPFSIEVSFKNALGPVFAGIFKEIGSGFNDRKDEREEYGNERGGANNQNTIDQTQGEEKVLLEGYNNNAVVKIDKTIIGVDDTGNTQIQIGMMKNLGDVEVKIQGTGDNCFGIIRNGRTISTNICTKTAKEYYNPNTEKYVFGIVLNEKKSGSTSLKIEFCPHLGGTSTKCITKQQTINIIPGPIDKIQVETPTDLVMEGAELPIITTASDIYGNTIGQNIQAYTISVNSGDGKLYDGTTANTKIKFDKFPGQFIYQAPIGLADNKNISVVITPDKTEKRLGATESVTIPKVIQKTIEVAKGRVTILQNNIVVYQNTNTQPINQPKIVFNLPKDETAIQYMDGEGTAQIVPANIPSIRITIKDIKKGRALTTVANITSKQGLLKPGTIEEKTINTNTGTKTQFIFQQANDFIITSGTKDITLYPNFKAGNDTITINIPGIDPIIIPVTVNAGPAKTILMTLEKSRLDFTTITTSKGTIHVVDSRNNKVTSGTTIKLGVIGSANTNTNEFVYTGNEYTYTVTAEKPGGEGYIFAYIGNRALSDQTPGYERFIIQENVLPKEKLNVMYLNLFGTDRGNQWGYFSENSGVINTITTQSNKLIATTTELVDPAKIKQIEYIVSPNGQIQSISNKASSLTIENKELITLMPEIAKIHLGMTENYQIQTVANSGAVSDFKKDANKIIYIPEPTDSVITSNEASKSKITINTVDVLDLEKGMVSPLIAISADNEKLVDMNTYSIKYNEKVIGKLLVWSNDNITNTTDNVDLQDPILYGQTPIFSEGSTNTQGIGIYVAASAFPKQGYASIEDSADPLLGIGFTSDFKNVANFANGKSVGEATLPYGSQFLINFGDPLLERREKNPEIPDTDFDASIGQTIYADPNKTIFRTLPIDFNNDGVKDLIVVYTDGVVKLVKNYGGTHPYKDLQELMIIAEPIKEIKVGDVDGNSYEDIVIITRNNKGVVYLNDKGIFPVDGKNICLNVNTEPDTINSTPDDFSNIKQMFVEDMDKDGKLDITTLDVFSDIKIFYGGSNSNGANYISSITGICDSNRYERQKNKYITVKRFGMKINSSRYIQDSSLIHRKGGEIPKEGVEEETDEEGIDTSNYTDDQLKALKGQSINDVENMIGNTDMYIASGATQLAYTDNPLSTSPVYESLSPEEVYYLPINETNDVANIYKEYKDMNGGILKNGDDVVIKTTIISRKNYNKLTYIDQLQGPREIAKDDENKIPSLVFTSNNTGGIIIDRNGPEGYQFVMDNIQLNSGSMLSFSYKVTYKADTSVIHIDVKDQDLLNQDKHKDQYPDIAVTSTDACLKNRRIFFNEKTGSKRSYEQIYDNIQDKIDTYNSGATTTQQDTIKTVVDQISSTDTMEGISNLPGMDSLETWNAKSLVSSLFSQGGLSLNINTSFIDDATAKVSKKIDTALQGLCQGFKIGKNGTSCQGIPVPFNQAFLAPGDYHIFGCVPKAPNPLSIPFKLLNQTLGKGLPILAFPTDGVIPFAIVGLPSPSGAGGIFGGNTSQFRLYIAPTLTLGLGIAMCFGPYGVGKALPKPFRDIGGNCIVFAVPPRTNCTSTSGDSQTEIYTPELVEAGKVGTCNNPPKIGNTMVFAGDDETQNDNSNTNGDDVLVSTASWPFQIVAAGSSENSPNYSAAIPQGNFGGLIAIDQEPTKVSADEQYGNATEQLEEGTTYEGYDLQEGEKANLKILGAKTKGLVKCVVQSWMTRQVQYIQNNLTKMTIQLDLPDMSTIFQGFDKIGNLEETYKSLQTQDKAEGYIQSTAGKGVDFNQKDATGGNNRTQYLSKQQLTNLSKSIGENPFEAIQQMFKEVPLINIDTKEINLKIPSLTSDDINKYVSYLTLRVEKNEQILEDWTDMLNQLFAMCGTTDKVEAQKIKKELESMGTLDIDTSTKERTKKEIAEMDKIIALSGNTTRQDMASDAKNIGLNVKNTTKKLVGLPYRKFIQGKLVAQKALHPNTFDKETQLNSVNTRVKQLEKCGGVSVGIDGFLSFRENTAGLIKSVKENINVLEKYKKFPTQLYQRTHVTDKYLTEISALLSDTVGSLTTWLDTNANRFSQYVDAIILLVGAIKTRQAIIDFSVNRSEKCSKCSNDNYGSFSCSLSFLCPKLPIFPIPAFKIPSVYMDLSHVEVGINVTLPKINFVPTSIPLPQIPNLPEPPTVEVDWDIMYDLNLKFFAELALPTIPVIPEPPTLPEPPSFIPSVKMQLPVLPPAPKIPKILPEIKFVLKIAEFIGKVFCIVKGGIGLVGEKGVKGKVEQLTQRTWNVPTFDYFNLTTKFKDPPLQGFDYKLDAYATLKFNFDGVYDVFNNIAEITNNFVSEKVEAPIQKAIDDTTNTLNNNSVTSGFDAIENFDQNINFNGYMKPEEETTGMMEYSAAYNELRQGLIQFKNSTLEDKTMNNRVKAILATVENKSTVQPATNQIQQVEKAAKEIINKKIQETETMQKGIQDYDTFIKKLQDKKVVLVSDTTLSTNLKTPILTIDSASKNILQAQEDPTKTYLTLNQRMVQGYLDAVNNDGPEKLNMSTSTYKKSKQYLETTKEKIDTALLAYNEPQLLAQGTCTNCSSETNKYSTDISMYTKGVFVESYSGNQNTSGGTKSMINTVSSAQQVNNVQKTYTTDVDLNNDTRPDILMYDANTVYVKYAQQESEHFSEGNDTLTNYYDKYYSYANQHPGSRFNPQQRYISSLDQLRNNSDAYGYMKINDIMIKVVDKNKEVKNFKTDGQTFDNLELSRKNSKLLGEQADAYVIKVSTKIDDKDTPSSFRDFLGPNKKPKYIIVLPTDTDYKKGIITLDDDMVKKPINLELGDTVLAVEYYDPSLDTIQLTLKDLPRKWLYTSIAALTINQDDLNNSQQKTLTLYKKSSPRSNQTVAGMQNLGDVAGPVGEIVLWRNMTNEAVSTGIVHEGYINTHYALKSTRTDNVIVAKMIIQKDGQTILEKDNTSQTGTIDLGGLFFTGTTQQSYDFIAIDQNNNIAKETVMVNIKIPDIEVIDLKKSGTETADIIAKISADLDEGIVIFQRLRNGIRKDIAGSNQNSYGGFDLSPKKTIITGGIFTIGDEIGLYDSLGNEIATLDPKTGEININQGYKNKVTINVNFNTHIPVVELRDTVKNITLFQIVLPIESISDIKMNQDKPSYEQLQLPDSGFGDFNNGYCIKNSKNDCIVYTNNAGAIYIPGIYASSLVGEYLFDKTSKKTTLVIKDQSGKSIATFTLKIRQAQ